MIVFNLSCPHEHGFEGWFASGDEFERQSREGLVTCPVCGSGGVTQRPSAPYVRRSGVMEGEVTQPEGARFSHLLESLRQIAEASEDVGENFAEEARRIHHEEAPARSIRGVASLDEAGELIEEGIPLLPLPFPKKKGVH